MKKSLSFHQNNLTLHISSGFLVNASGCLCPVYNYHLINEPLNDHFYYISDKFETAEKAFNFILKMKARDELDRLNKELKRYTEQFEAKSNALRVRIAELEETLC